MKLTRIPALLAAAALTLTACTRESGEQPGPEDGNPLLNHVPADTPYLFANIEPTPPEVIDAFMLRLAPALSTAQSLLDDFTLEINTEDPDEHREARLLGAILAEFDGQLNREGLESMGLSLESHKAIYGMGVFPTIRVALKDAGALRATIARIEEAAGMSFDSFESGGTEYWRISDGKNSVGIYIAILDDHVAMSLFPAVAETEWLPALLGQDLPANSIGGATVLEDLNRAKGYSSFGSGFLDLQRIAGELLDSGSRTTSVLRAAGHQDAGELDAVCISEIKSLVAKAPRLTGGTTELTADTVAVSYELEMQPSLAGKLAGLAAEVPVADRNPEKIFSASLGLRMGRLRDFALEQATAVKEAPFQCAKLAQLNTQAQTMLTQLNQPMPPFINNLKGFRLSLDKVDFENFQPENTRGLLSLEVEKPQMLIGMGQMFVPGLDGLELEPGADPVEVPLELLSFAQGDMRMYAAMTDDSIGLAVGADREAELASFMDADADNDGTFFSMEYDMSAPMEFRRRMQAQFGESGEAHDLVEAIQQSYLDWMGRSRVELRFNGEGLQIDTRMTFK